jgi:hypothetical protein
MAWSVPYGTDLGGTGRLWELGEVELTRLRPVPSSTGLRRSKPAFAQTTAGLRRSKPAFAQTTAGLLRSKHEYNPTK